LAALQHDGRCSIQKISETAGLSARASLERVRRLEAAGIIRGYHAAGDLTQLSRPGNIFSELYPEEHAEQSQLEQRLSTIDEIVECWQVSGAVDYLARFVCIDLPAYEALTTRLIDDPKLGVARIVSHVALRPIRRFAGYPESLLFKKPD